MPDGWFLALLGPVRMTHDGQPINFGGRTAGAVLAALALSGHAGASVDDLLRAVWPEPDPVSESGVHQHIRTLRVAFAPHDSDVITIVRNRYHLALGDSAVDWQRFQQLVALARDARRRENLEDAADRFGAALALWTGPPLADIGNRLIGDRRVMAEARLTALEELAGVQAARGRPEAVYDLLTAEVARGPIRERLAVLLIEALTSLGRRDEASA